MGASRTQITKTPGKITFDGVDFYSSDPITVELREEMVEIASDRIGTYDEMSIGRMVVVKMKPTQFTAAALAKLFTHAAMPRGSSIIGSSDRTLDIHTIDGKLHRVPCGFIFGEPAMTCMTGQTILGEVTWYGVLPLAADPATLASFWAITSTAFSDSTWDPDHELTPGWNASWGITGTPSDWDDMDTVGGVTFTPRSVLDEDKSDRDGLRNVTIRDYGVDIACKVQNISEALVTAAMGWGLKYGQKRSSVGRALKMRATTGDAFIYAPNAVLQPVSLGFGAGRTVVQDLAWKTRPGFTGGALNPHLIVTTEDPDAEPPEDPDAEPPEGP
jgi:hypothetical protein